MAADAPFPQWRARVPRLSISSVSAVVVVGLALLGVMVPGTPNLGALAYLVLVLVTCIVLRGARREPGSWLGRRLVRRTLVVGLAATCVATLAVPGPTAGDGASGQILLGLLLIVLNLVLGQATRRMATALDQQVDEREEALRNHAHHLAYWLFAAMLSLLVLVPTVAGAQSRAWLGNLSRGGASIVFLELMFLLPAMTLAWLEPDHIVEDGLRRPNPRLRLAVGLLALTFAVPFALSAISLLTVRTTSSSTAVVAAGSPAQATVQVPDHQCREYFALTRVGRGVEAQVPLHATACWDGHTASEGWGMNASDCLVTSSVLMSATTEQCTRTIDSGGNLTFVYRVVVRPSLLPFLSRPVTMRLKLRGNGTVVRFP